MVGRHLESIDIARRHTRRELLKLVKLLIQGKLTFRKLRNE